MFPRFSFQNDTTHSTYEHLILSKRGTGDVGRGRPAPRGGPRGQRQRGGGRPLRRGGARAVRRAQRRPAQRRPEGPASARPKAREDQ